MRRSKIILISIVILMVFSSLAFPETVKSDITIGKSKLIPPDPSESVPFLLTKPTNKMNATLVKAPLLLPYVVPNHVIIKLALPDIDDVSKSQIKVFEDGREQGFVLFKESELRKRADIAIVIDVTGSMGEAIAGVKNSILKFADELTSQGLDVKIAVVPFGDYLNPPSDCISNLNPPFLDFVDPLEVKNYVEKKLYANGGGDDPENPYDAIVFAAEKLSWRANSQRVIILITDANAHYRGDGKNYSHYRKEEVIDVIRGKYIVHGVFIPTWFYSNTSSNFSSPDDPREISVKSGGIIKYTDRSGYTNLGEIGIAEYTASSWLLVFESDSPKQLHTIEIFYKNNDDERYVKLENVDYVTGKEVKTGK